MTQLFELLYFTGQEEFEYSLAKPVKLPCFYIKARHAMVIQLFHKESREISSSSYSTSIIVFSHDRCLGSVCRMRQEICPTAFLCAHGQA